MTGLKAIMMKYMYFVCNVLGRLKIIMVQLHYWLGETSILYRLNELLHSLTLACFLGAWFRWRVWMETSPWWCVQAGRAPGSLYWIDWNWISNHIRLTHCHHICYHWRTLHRVSFNSWVFCLIYTTICFHGYTEHHDQEVMLNFMDKGHFILSQSVWAWV